MGVLQPRGEARGGCNRQRLRTEKITRGLGLAGRNYRAEFGREGQDRIVVGFNFTRGQGRVGGWRSWSVQYLLGRGRRTGKPSLL